MDPLFDGLSDPDNGFLLNQETIFPSSDQYPNLTNGPKFEDNSLDFNFMDLPFIPPSNLDTGNSVTSSSESPDGGSPSEDSDDPVLKYISQMLMEEDMEKKPCMLRDCLALHAAEKSFYEVIGEKYPPSPNQHPLYQNAESPDDNFSSTSFSDYGSNSTVSIGTCNSVDPSNSGDLGEYNPSLLPTLFPVNYLSQSTFEPSSHLSFTSSNSFSNNSNGLLDTPVSVLQVPNFFSDSESALQFKRGVEEASKFLPSNNNLIIDLESYTSPLGQKEVAPEVVIKAGNGEREHSPSESRGRKREEIDLEGGRSNKQFAVYVEEADLSDMFDRVLLCGVNEASCQNTVKEVLQNGSTNNLEENGQPRGSNGGKSRVKKQVNKKDVVDLRTLLILCAQAVSSDDRRTATELLKRIRQHSSSSGDGSQRLAHCFANALQARLDGTGTQIYTALASKRISTADILKAYQVFIQACPFKKIPIAFANKNILKAAEKAKTLHIVDFGILYGFQWPMLIHLLSTRPGGPPKLRITGIDLPQPGFRPAERVEETGRRLAKYCERYNVPFEYNAIAQKWDTIQIVNLKIDRNEVLVVNCLYRLKNLLDETVVVNSPRNAVLSLIRKMNPDLFIHAVVNGSYNAPFFVTRFREALFHFSALFDMFETNVPRESPERSMFEEEIYGQEVINIVACEGSERVERPETYKQWQVRNTRAGFERLPLDQETMKQLKTKLKSCYHKDFVIDEDGHWMLVGWKGRIVYASSCWVPS